MAHLAVTLHLMNGHALTLPMTRPQKERVARTLNQPALPSSPFVTEVSGERVEIPWRNIAYLTSKEAV